MKVKKKSKRQPLKLKFSIQKKSVEHRKKLKKAAKHAIVKKRKRKDPGVPNNWPFKKQILENLQKKRQALELERARKKIEAKRNATLRDIELDDAPMLEDVGGSMEGIAAKAAKDAMIFEAAVEQNTDDDAVENTTEVDSSRKAFFKHLRKVIEMSDVLLMVLDARDPNACRSATIERDILGAGKKLVFVINKIDLVTPAALDQWIRYLKRNAPVVAFKAARSSSVTHVEVNPVTVNSSQLSAAHNVVGADNLISLLKNYQRISGSSGSKVGITVGVIGLPNVGKSSVINSLKRSACAVRTGGQAGVTRQLQEVMLDKKVKLVDSPGVTFSDKQSVMAAVFCNAVSPQTIANPVATVESLLGAVAKHEIMRSLQIPCYQNVDEFLCLMARKTGKLIKGGRPDMTNTAIMVLNNWASGTIPFHTLPPKDTNDLEQIIVPATG